LKSISGTYKCRLPIKYLHNFADKSLARPTSRCRRTESIVSLEIHAIVKEILGEMYHRMPPSKTGWPSLNVAIFPPFFFPGRAKDLSIPRYLTHTKVTQKVRHQLMHADSKWKCSSVDQITLVHVTLKSRTASSHWSYVCVYATQ
jgi:hypothetical protein